MVKDNKIKKGFSIGEVMLSVFILGTTLTALISLYATGIKHLVDERENIIASLLAQEGIELVRNKRDNNWINGRVSFNGLGARNNCSLSYNNDICGTSLNLNYDGSYYTHGTGASTKFRRRIRIEGTGTTRTITSLVTWNSTNPPIDFNSCNTGNKCVFSSATLTEWGE